MTCKRTKIHHPTAKIKALWRAAAELARAKLKEVATNARTR